MSQAKPVNWFEDDPKPNTFFFQSPFRSWKFVLTTTLAAGVSVACVALIWDYWDRISRHSYHLTIISFFLLTVLRPYLLAIQRQGKIRKLYRAGEINEAPANSPFDQILQVADNSVNEGILVACVLFGLYLFMIAFWEIPHIK
ncbi:MAG TPA: hypothetical protein VEI73_09855 [Candidatus Acidoferrum sp.]|nr:hypothetical protein [Candidatus Acidoferrum sp.]